MKNPVAQLLVHVDPSPGATLRLNVACQLAQRLGASVTALYAASPHYVDVPYGPSVSIDLAAVMREIDDDQLARARAAFDAAQASAPVRAAWAEIQDDPVIGSFAQQALYADWLVLGQQGKAGDQEAHVPGDFVESVVVASGKPALVLPLFGQPAPIGDKVVIAWKPTREAARAVAAALPLLQGAKNVHVVSWATPEDPVRGARLDLAGYLKLHGVSATWHPQGAETKDLGEMLLSRAFDLQADLLVMGCYGHSRAREWVLGGVSRTIMDSMTLPVLLSH
jgi:nucleotide-binding universal stress UspA family protein